MRGILFRVKREVLKNKVLITGFHGVGYTGWIALRYLVKELKSRRIGYIHSIYTPPFVSMEDGIRTPYELYLAGDFVLFVPNIPFSNKEITLIPYVLSRVLIKKGLREAILIGGLDSRLREEGTELKIAATTSYMKGHKDILKVLNASKIEDYLYIVGPLATMLAIFEMMSFPALTLLPYADVGRPDPRAAAIAIQKLNVLFGTNISVTELLKEEERVLKEIEEIQRRIQQVRGEEHHRSLYV